MTNTKRELFCKLRNLYNDKDFVVGVMSNAQSEEVQKRIIDYINEGRDVSQENIILLSLHKSNKK